MMNPAGAYKTSRAAALSGVPRSTVDWWVRHSVIGPSVSIETPRLWSYADIMKLRIIYWLRKPKSGDPHIPATEMPDVRRALRDLEELGTALWTRDRGTPVRVDRSGKITIHTDDGIRRPGGQLAIAEFLDLTGPFESERGIRGPDLVRPRPYLRIVPGKLCGEPHVVDTRLETNALAALDAAGLSNEKIRMLYPYVSGAAIEEAVELERQLAHNLAA